MNPRAVHTEAAPQFVDQFLDSIREEIRSEAIVSRYGQKLVVVPWYQETVNAFEKIEHTIAYLLLGKIPVMPNKISGYGLFS